MRFVLSILIALTVSRVSHADPDFEIKVATTWVNAMHGQDFKTAAATTTLPFTLDGKSLAKTDEVVKALTETGTAREGVFRRKTWNSTSITLVSAKEANVKVAEQQRVVKVVIRAATSSTSWAGVSYILIESPVHTGFAITAIESGPMIIAN